MQIQVESQQGRRTCQASPGQTLLDVLRDTVQLQAPCGGNGSCGKCRVILVEPEGERTVLACQTQPRDGMVVRVPRQEPLQVALDAEARTDFQPDPGQTGWGIACDIGTTTVVCRLVELATGKALAVQGRGNVQCSFGADVISRIKAAMDGQLSQLTQAIREQLSEMIVELCRKAGVEPERVASMAVAGNTTMCHLLMGLDPSGLGAAPFTSLSRFGGSVPAQDLQLPFDGPVYVCPAVSGYVGGDITAGLTAVRAARAERPILFVDVGTNGEMALGGRDGLLCCSTAAGPAFEGACISCGMGASDGAIDKVWLEDGQLRCSVLGGGEPAGVCGSGLVDALAVLLALEVVDETGRLLPADEAPPAWAGRIEGDGNGTRFRLAGNVWLTSGDVRQLQLAKAAVSAGIQTLLAEAGVAPEELSAFYLAGGFGSYLRPESAAAIGLFPAVLLDKIRVVGNSAGAGASAVPLSAQAEERCRYLELSGLPRFNEAYLDCMGFE